MSHCLKEGAAETLLMRQTNLSDEQRSCGEDKVRAKDRHDGCWETEGPVGLGNINDSEKQVSYCGQRGSGN